MPSRAYTSFLQYPFKNLDFMRFPEPVFAGIYQNILTTAVFRSTRGLAPGILQLLQVVLLFAS